jgi:hypothetical protein
VDYEEWAYVTFALHIIKICSMKITIIPALARLNTLSSASPRGDACRALRRFTLIVLGLWPFQVHHLNVDVAAAVEPEGKQQSRKRSRRRVQPSEPPARRL